LKSATDEGRVQERYLLAMVQAEFQAALRVREERFTSSIAAVYNTLFAGTPGHTLMRVLLGSGPLSPKNLADACGYGKRSILEGGSIRKLVERLQQTGIVVNLGSQARPRFSLVQDELLKSALRKLYAQSSADDPSSKGATPP
jgi:hypothetical protein